MLAAGLPCGGLVGLTAMHQGAGPLGVPLVAIARLGIRGRFDTLGRRWEVATRLETHAGPRAVPLQRHGADWPFVVTLPGAAQRRDARERADRLGRLGRLEGVQHGEPILADHLGIGLTGRLLPGPPGILDTRAIAVIPLQRRPGPPPIGGHGRQVVQILV